MMQSKAFVISVFVLGFVSFVFGPARVHAETAPAASSSPASSDSSLVDPSRVSLKGKPRLVRGSPRTEVFFSDLPTSYWIEQDRHHNAFQKAFLEAARKGKTLGFTADEDNRKILSIEGVKTEPVRYEVEEILEVKTQK